ncbi:MAG: hypothetical protein IJT94_16300 [Oscillibacter sp.]|nr:hypothetical protein [Oscillibacter sp.]
MKKFEDFLSLVESAEGQEAVYQGTPELIDPRRLHGALSDPDRAAAFFNALHRCSVQSTLNLLRMYHQWQDEQ